MLKPLMQTWRQTWRLAGFCAMATLSLATSAHAKLGAYIRAEPLTVIVPAGQTQGTTTLDWDSGSKDEQAQVWQKVDDGAEKRLSNKPNGNRVVTIKVDEKRTFTLYKNASSSTQKTPPLIEIGKVAPQRNSKGNWEFAPIAAAFARFAPLQDGRRVLDLNVQQEELSLNTTYFYIINVFNDDKSDASLPRAQKTGQFITQNQSVKVVWESVHITNDSDPNGAGEIDLAAHANHGEPGAKVNTSSRQDLPDGRTQPLNWTQNISNAPDTLSLALCGNDDDATSSVFHDVEPYYNGPGDDGYYEWNIAKGKFDLTQYPGASVTVPFDLRSMPNGGDAGDLEFEAKGYIVITRG